MLSVWQGMKPKAGLDDKDKILWYIGQNILLESSNLHTIHLSLKTFETRNETKLIKVVNYPGPPQLLFGPK